MEDKGRGMETDKRLKTQLKKKRKKSKGLTVMIIRRVGKVRSFELSGRSVLIVIIFLLLYIPTSIFFVNSYFQLRHRYGERTNELQRAEKVVEQAENELFELTRHYESLLYDSKNDAKTEKEAVAEASVEKDSSLEDKKKDKISPNDALIKKSEDSEKPKTGPENEPKAQPLEVVAIQELSIQKEGSYIDVDFKLVNLQPGEGESLGGYVHIIAETWDSYPPQVWTSPKVTLKNGYPINFRKGELFIIKRFKPINRRIDLFPSSDNPSIIRVLIYNRVGELKLEKEFDVNDGT